MNVDGISFYTKSHVTDTSDQEGRIYIGREELKVRRIGYNAMLEQDAVHIGCEADLAAHVLDVLGRQLSLKLLLDTGAVVSVMPLSIWTDMGFDRSDLKETDIRLASANRGGIYVIERTPIISLRLKEDIFGWASWLSKVWTNPINSSWDLVRNFDVSIDLNDGKYVRK